MADQCRCGFDGNGDHPCHGNGYSCKQPATQRFIATNAALPGIQPKLGAYQTWACDACWAEYKKK